MGASTIAGPFTTFPGRRSSQSVARRRSHSPDQYASRVSENCAGWVLTLEGAASRARLDLLCRRDQADLEDLVSRLGKLGSLGEDPGVELFERRDDRQEVGGGLAASDR